MLERYEPINPPEIREPQETYRIVEFYAHLGNGRADIKLFSMIETWLQDQAPCALLHLSISYHRATETEPDMMVGMLTIGAPIDIG